MISIIIIIFATMLYVTIAFYLSKAKGYKFKDFFSLNRIKAVYIWLLKKHLKKIDGSDFYLSKNDLLQYAFRVARCGDCLQEQKCKYCTCDVEGKINVRTDLCGYTNNDGDMNFGAFLNDEEFDDFLKENKLVFNVKIEKR